MISVELLEQSEKFKLIELFGTLVLLVYFTFMNFKQFILFKLAFKAVVLIDELLADLGELLVWDHAFSVAITASKHNLNLERCKLNLLASFESLIAFNDADFSGFVCVRLGKFLPDEHGDVAHVVVHHLTDGNLIPHVVKHIWEFLIFDSFAFLESY